MNREELRLEAIQLSDNKTFQFAIKEVLTDLFWDFQNFECYEDHHKEYLVDIKNKCEAVNMIKEKIEQYCENPNLMELDESSYM